MGKLPKAVQEAADRARKLVEEQARKEENPVVEEEEEVVESDETEVEDNEALGEEEEEEEEEETDDSDLPSPEEDEEEDNEEETVKKEETVEYWKSRFQILQGKYNSEVPTLSAKVRQLEAQLATFEKLDETPESESFSLKESDYEDYGEEFITLVKAVNALEKRNAHLEKLAQGLTSKSQVLNKETFEDRLTETVPDWRVINVQPDFMTWLQEPDGYSGQTRHDSLIGAYNKLDVKTVANIFKKFKTAFSIPENKKRIPKNSIESEIQPSRIKTEKPITPKKQSKKWTRKEIAQFYRNKAENKIDPKKAKVMERDIFLANQEGRIVG